MEIRLKLDSLQYRAAVARLIAEKRADAKLLLDEEARLLVRDLVAVTPPHTKREGERSVEVNLRRAFNPLDPKKFSAKLIATLIRKRDVGGLNAIFARAKGKFAGMRIVEFFQMRAIHKRLTNSRGRVSKAGYPVLPQDFAAYLKRVQASVGWAKAGWMAAAQRLGLSLPAYITRHSGRLGSVSFSPAPKLGITLMNFSTKIPNYQAKVDFAVGRRYRSMVREAARILAGGKSRRGSFAGTSTGAPS
jgi:hypothetical protein